jgi:hypothetical protein
VSPLLPHAMTRSVESDNKESFKRHLRTSIGE